MQSGYWRLKKWLLPEAGSLERMQRSARSLPEGVSPPCNPQPAGSDRLYPPKKGLQHSTAALKWLR